MSFPEAAMAKTVPMLPWMLLALVFSGSAGADSYTSVQGPDSNVDDLWFYQAEPRTLVVSGYRLRYQMHYLHEVLNGTPYSAEMVHGVVVDASGQFFSFLKAKGLSVGSECRTTDLNLHQLSMEVLNDRGRFNEWPEQNGLPQETTQSIWALYDPLFEDPAVASIYLTDHGSQNVSSLAHELSHYWFDRLCIYRQWTEGTEAFAVEFERWYRAGSSKPEVR
jgi:hypothetical protein